MTVATVPANAGTACGAVVGGDPVVVVAIGIRGRGDVSIGGDAAGEVVVVVLVVVVVEDAADRDDVADVSRGEPDDEHAPANVTTPMSATHRPRPRRTLS